MAKARPTSRVWAVRESQGAGHWYWLLLSSRKPSRPRKGWALRTNRYSIPVRAIAFEKCFPNLHLKPNGGPIEIRIVKVKAVTT